MCFDEGFLGFLLRGGDCGLRPSQVPCWSAAVGSSFDPRPQSVEGRGNIGSARVSVEIFDPLLMVEALQLDRVLPSIEYDRKEGLTSGVVGKLWIAEN